MEFFNVKSLNPVHGYSVYAELRQEVIGTELAVEICYPVSEIVVGGAMFIG